MICYWISAGRVSWPKLSLQNCCSNTRADDFATLDSKSLLLGFYNIQLYRSTVLRLKPAKSAINYFINEKICANTS